MRIDTETLSVPAQVGLTKGPVSGSDRRPFAESWAALERGTPRPRNTKDRPVGGLHVPADRGRSFVWQQRSSLTIRPLVKSKTQVFDNGGAMSHVRCPFVAGFPAPRGKRAPRALPRGVDPLRPP